MRQLNPVTTTLWLIFLLYWLTVAAFAKRSRAKGTWWRGALFRALLALGVVLLSETPPVDDALQRLQLVTALGVSPTIVAIGEAICGLGLALAIWGRTHLGRNWGVPMSLREGHELVTSGPYALVRHPIYGGILFALFGSALAEGPVTLMLLVAFCAYFICSARIEEIAMSAEFPNEYPPYKQRTKMFVPFVF